MSRRPSFPAYYVRTYPGGSACGHQHHKTGSALNCADQIVKRPGIDAADVIRVRKNSDEKIIATVRTPTSARR